MLPTACLVNSEDPDKMLHYAAFHLGLHCLLLKTKLIFRERNTFLGERGILAYILMPKMYTMDHPDIIVQNVCRADLKKMLVVLMFVKE